MQDIEVFDRLDERATFVHHPEAATSLVFRTTADGRSDLIAAGPRSRGSYLIGKAVKICVRVRLRPGRARKLLGVSPAELVDRAVPLTDLWGSEADRLIEEWAGADPRRLMSHLARSGQRPTPNAPARPFPHARPLPDAHPFHDAHSLPDSRPFQHERPLPDAHPFQDGPLLQDTHPLLEAAMRELAGPARLSEVATRLGVSDRHLRALFAREVGLSPKHVARIQRVRRVLALAGHREWATVAGDAGFFDQAHMITDFRSMMGVAPGAYLAGHHPAATTCAATRRPPAIHS